MPANQKEIIMYGMRPTGELHLGHFFGVIKNQLEMQNKYKSFLMIADLHALTTLEETKNIKSDILKMVALWLASGIDPKKSTIFVQSYLPEHTTLSTILGNISPLSMLELNPTYKEMKKEHPKSNTLGLFSYPVLQSADILLYKATRVPIGKDQEPHLELARELVRRFNNRFPAKNGASRNVFVEPQALFSENTKISSLQDPLKKMSKSHKADSYISLLDSPEKIRSKIKKAVTDSGAEIKYLPNEKPALAGLLTLYHLSSGMAFSAIEKKFKGLGYKEFKEDLAERIINLLAPIQKKYSILIKNPSKIKKILKAGSKQAQKTASQTLAKAKKTVGI